MIESLKNDNKFTKRMFRYLVNDEVITGNQLCLALFAQGVLDDNPRKSPPSGQGAAPMRSSSSVKRYPTWN